MKILFIKTVLSILISTCALSYASAAKITIEAPSQASSNRQTLTVRVFLDAETDKISGIAGNFSFPRDMFDVESISTQSSIVSLWVTQPKISDERYLDNRTHITFEGIFPGGYEGVRGAYYEGEKAGILYSVTLTPKNKGIGAIIIDDITINSFTSDAKPLPADSPVHTISVPQLIPVQDKVKQELVRTENTTLQAFVTRSELVNRNAWYLMVHERESLSSIDKVYVAETAKVTAESVADKEWRVVVVPYVLLYQDRTKYIHIKVVYSNDTFTLRTITPVENSKSISGLSRILIGVLGLLFVVYFYGKHVLSLFHKKN